MFIILGIQFLEFSIGWGEVFAVIVTSCVVEIALFYFVRGIVTFPWAALSSAFSLILFFRAINIEYMIFAAALAIASKYLIRFRGKHIFNPSNFAIVAMTLLLPTASTVQFIEWNNNLYLYLFICVVTISVAYATRTISMTISFLTSYLILLLISISYLPETFAAHHFGMISPVLVIFATFMITDPKTAPRTLAARIIFGISISVTYFLLELHGMRYSLFVALFIVLAANAVFSITDSWFSAPVWKRIVTLNLPTFVILCIVFIYAYSVYVIMPKHEFSPTLPSIQFVLFGIQTSELFMCSPNPVLQPHAGGLGQPAVTQGGSWGDYNNDGYDDMFVSNWDKPSRLYRNNQDGTFTDVTEQVGLPLQSSSSAFFADWNNSGELSLFVVDPREPAKSGTSRDPYGPDIVDGQVPALSAYKYVDGKYVDITKKVGLGSFFWDQNGGGSMSFGDYNNDGRLDFVIETLGEYASIDLNNQSFRITDADPVFTSSYDLICDERKIRPLLASTQNSLDKTTRQQIKVFLAKNEKCLLANRSLQRFADLQSTTTSARPQYSGNFILLVPGSMHLFENTGNGFIEKKGFADYIHSIWQADSTGSINDGNPDTETMTGRYFQPVSFDYDGDGKLDIFTSVDFGRSILLKNMGNWSFKDVTQSEGLDYSGTGMGVAVADVAGNGAPSILVTNVLDDFLYRNKGNGTFSPQTRGISRSGVGWGASFLDYNLDGFPDLYIANGDFTFVGPLPLLPLSTSFFRADRLYENVNGVLTDRTWHDFCPDAQSGKTVAISDYDNDGDPDVFVGNINFNASDPLVYSMGLPSGGRAGNVLYENKTNSPERIASHYLEIKLSGTTSNRMGIGSIVHVTSAGRTQTQFSVLGGSFFGQNSATLDFGLGANATPVDIQVRWPSGHITTLHNISVDQRILISESE